MVKKSQAIHIGILVLTFEKIMQHVLTALFFVVDIPGIGRPDIGPYFWFGDATMAILNIIMGILFVLGFGVRLQGRVWHRRLLVGLALFDILAEFIFHGFFFLTVSVLVATGLLILLWMDVRLKTGNK